MASTFMTDDDHDLLLVNGRLQLETDPVIAAAIKLKHRLRFFKGEWWLDTRVGVPYYDIVYVKNPDLEIIRRMLRSVILSCDPITNVKKLDLVYKPRERVLIFFFEATAEDGRVVAGGSGSPFLVDGRTVAD